MSRDHQSITFYRRFENDILNGRKTITVRDSSECHFQKGQVLSVFRNEDQTYICNIEVDSVIPVNKDELDDQHASQENMSLSELKHVIDTIYPGVNQLYVISFHLTNKLV
ncbi:UCP029143 family protein [Heterostelium album PN500]|uniref:UCP029143 family protein n=1 Tax=Heterostelium pallidum (strain ATCC 26659 / Pp 5 / PN500) TaxID=670386 RepID=D3AZN3_HETP5|nr:UCP029143 family protein [Heterostelium album PN500]EFA85412.1 UCP029143 family protein [Heterostelium album PN500]|eukprot:XP_020437521.1 UCP029143 family protein [Heterostelium album PN500]